jgi:hypothetical protein
MTESAVVMEPEEKRTVVADDIDDDFGDFDSPAVMTESTVVMEPEEKCKVVTDDNDDDFGDFDAPTGTRTEAVDDEVDEDFGDFGDFETVAGGQNEVSFSSGNDFGDFDTPVKTPAAIGGFGDFDSPSSQSQPQPTTSQDDDFGDFGDFDENTSGDSTQQDSGAQGRNENAFTVDNAALGDFDEEDDDEKSESHASVRILFICIIIN